MNDGNPNQIKEAGSLLVEAVVDQADSTLNEAKNMITDKMKCIQEKACEAQKCTENYVKDNPWKTIGLAIGVGYILRLICQRR
ncbi:MAG: hypothetical protein SGI98_03825 [Verrucomicrobiota bacterium]|nr:hypothetical protein [Verrucomicrobiota bacterium]